MSTEVLTALAAAGSTALVGAIATDVWETARNEMARLFGRGGARRQAAIEAQLDGNVVLVERANDPDKIRQLLAQLWQLELTRLLEEYPDVESDLRDIIARVQDTLPAEQKQWVQNNIAGGSGVVYGVQGGTQTIHHHHVPTLVPRSAAGGEGLLERRDGV